MARNSMPFTVSLDLALAGASAPPSGAYEAALVEAERALDWLRTSKLELLANVEREDDIAEAAKAAASFTKDASDIFVLGTGGSSLGAQALAGLLPWGRKKLPRVTFLDNLDGKTFAEALAACELKTTRFLAISKSGTTPETLMQTLAAADAIRTSGGKHLDQHFLVVTEAKPSALRRFAESISCAVLEHPPGIGGRYAVLSIVGLLPALLMGLDARAARTGARSALAAAFAAPDSPPAAGAALHFALYRAERLRETVLWPYCDRLKTFGSWWRQLWAESLGKNGQGITPIPALGPVDQHSQLQLFLDGPGGQVFTLISTDSEGRTVPQAEAQRLGVGYLAGKHMGDLVAAEARATAETLAKRKRPVRRIHVPHVDEAAMGALFMHFMLETIIMGRLMRIDPFDQPAVEEGKALARAYLEGKR